MINAENSIISPKTAVIIDQYDKEKEIPVENIKVGDFFVVRSGDIVPVDGVVVEGNCAVDESALTGERIAANKTIGSEVSASTINNSGYIKCRATRVGNDTILSQIIRMVSDASKTKAPIEKTAHRLSTAFVLAVLVIAVITLIIWIVAGAEPVFAVTRAVSVILISCPWILWLIVPVAIKYGIRVGSKNGILFKTSKALENTGKAQIVALDKTRTITKGDSIVTDIFTVDSISRSGYSLINNQENELLKIAGLLERKSEHPLARAVVSYVGDINSYIEDLDDDEIDDVTDFEVIPGNGLKANYKGSEIIGASFRYISGICKILPEVREKAVGLAAQGKTPLCYAKDGRLIGIIAVTDTIKEDSAKTMKDLKNLGIHTVMITGENQRTAMAIGDQAGVDEIAAEILSDKKEAVIEKLAEHGKVAMVGYGKNSAQALATADIGIAIGARNNVAIESADVVMMKNNLSDVTGAMRLSRAVLKNIYQNLLWMVIYNIIGIPLAAGVFIKTFGVELSPLFCVVATCLFAMLVLINVKSLKSLNIYDDSKDKPLKNPITEEILRTEVLEELKVVSIN